MAAKGILCLRLYPKSSHLLDIFEVVDILDFLRRVSLRQFKMSDFLSRNS